MQSPFADAPSKISFSRKYTFRLPSLVTYFRRKRRTENVNAGDRKQGNAIQETANVETESRKQKTENRKRNHRKHSTGNGKRETGNMDTENIGQAT